MIPEPTLIETIDAARKSVQGQADKNADFTRGSDYEVFAGANAILWTRQARRDTDLFKATRFHDAQGEDLTRLVHERYGIARYLDTRGTGVAVLSRAVAAIADTVWAGTRIRIRSESGLALFYRVVTPQAVPVGTLSAIVDIEACEIGPTTRVTASNNADLEDPLADAGWTVSFLECSGGSVFESAADLIARVRKTRTDSRVGYPQAIIDACKGAGAVQVVVLRSDFGGDALDQGLNVTYVGDSGYLGSADLVKACTVAVRAARVAGDHMQVLPMAVVRVNIVAKIYLRDAPTAFDISRLEAIHYASIRRYLNGANGDFGYTRVGLTSAIARNTEEVQNVVFSSPTVDVGILSSGNFPAVLNRYVAGDISLTYVAP